jgi:transposase-like protein
MNTSQRKLPPSPARTASSTRRDVVARLRQQGWSLRRIAGRLGVHHTTLLKDRQATGGENSPPDNSDNAPTVTGADGKQYPARRAQALARGAPTTWQRLSSWRPSSGRGRGRGRFPH